MSTVPFKESLDELTREVGVMGRDVEALVERATELIGSAEAEQEAAAIAGEDEDIDGRELQIEERSIDLLERHQPLTGGDLRALVTVLKVNNDLERIGDHAVNIARAAARLGEPRRTASIPPELGEMGRVARGMLRDAVDAFLQGDADAAVAVRGRDDRVDQLQQSLFRMMLTGHTGHGVGGLLQVILIGRNLERIADLATNIGEEVVYRVEGRTVRHTEHRVIPRKGSGDSGKE